MIMMRRVVESILSSYSDKRDRNKATYSCLTKIVFCCAHSEQLNTRCS